MEETGKSTKELNHVFNMSYHRPNIIELLCILILKEDREDLFKCLLHAVFIVDIIDLKTE